MRHPPTPLDAILQDIDRGFQRDLYYLALHLCLSIPDICSALETKKDDRERYKVEQRYVAWCKRYLEPQFSRFTAEDCWALRGGVIHNGMLFGHPKARYDKVIFTLPNPRILIHETLSENNGGIVESALTLDLGEFCGQMKKAAADWYYLMKDDMVVAANMPNLVRFRPEGVWPHIVGVAAIS